MCEKLLGPPESMEIYNTQFPYMWAGKSVTHTADIMNAKVDINI